VKGLQKGPDPPANQRSQRLSLLWALEPRRSRAAQGSSEAGPLPAKSPCVIRQHTCVCAGAMQSIFMRSLLPNCAP
jgi:hypothetical protein